MPSSNFNDLLYFRRWSGRPYGIFASLRKQIKICVLGLTVSIVVNPARAIAQIDTLMLSRNLDEEEVVITASRPPVVLPESARPVITISAESIRSAPQSSLAETLHADAATDIRQRGAPGVQADIGIRGSTFDQTLILLNNINFSNPQTGHHAFDIPLHPSWVREIEIIKGPAARLYGPNALAGAVNLIPPRPDTNRFSFAFGSGMHKMVGGQMSLEGVGKRSDYFFGASHQSHAGYTRNTDAALQNFFASRSHTTGAGRVQLMAGYTHKAFGANSFYSPKYPEQFEETHSGFFSADYLYSAGRMKVNPVVYFRRHYDRFELFRLDSPEWYKGHNYHTTGVMGLRVPFNFYWDWGSTAFGIEIRRESVLSNVLGETIQIPVPVPFSEAFYNKYASRLQSSVFVNHSVTAGQWFVSGGVMMAYFRGLSHPTFFPGFEVSYALTGRTKCYAAFNQALRLPTFTDLYYAGPTNLPNPGLKPEESTSWETGVEYRANGLSVRADAFVRHGKDLIDWVKYPGNDKWQSMNHTALLTYGFEAGVVLGEGFMQNAGLPAARLSAGYALLRADKNDQGLTSLYVLDQLGHKVNLGLRMPIARCISVSATLRWQQREGTYALWDNDGKEFQQPYGSHLLLDAKLTIASGRLLFFIQGNNLGNFIYYDHGGVPLPGRWITTGIEYSVAW